MPGHILAIAPHYGFATTGGLQLALRDLFDGLRARGWTFDILTPVGTTPAPDARRVLSAAYQRRAIGRVQRYPAIRNVWQSAAVPRVARDFVRALGHDPNADRAWSHDLGVIAEWLRRRRHDLVLAVVWPPAPPGMLALVTAQPTPVVAVSLEGLGEELGNPFWPLARRRAERLLGKAIAPTLWRRVDPRALQTVVFA
ncbi:MAG: hypothetical protein NZ518_11840, partial [Dehalococcoidia bacterium]|nr:hypothetical protein [Dehalococcoidia bacterium]